jgi:histidinol-phosphate/aromatic aminotransferase/cobyric acid decarboxylase-like protein
VPLPAFDPYPNATEAVGATAVRVPPGRGFAFPTRRRCVEAITPRTRLIFLNTPNNPTGQLIPVEDIRRIAEAAPQAIVIVDEAYIEFGGSRSCRSSRRIRTCSSGARSRRPTASPACASASSSARRRRSTPCGR